MHPSLSIIFFTTATGAGYGLLALLGLCGAFGLLPPTLWFGLAAFGSAFLLVTGGLLASTLHLGHPERAWRAFTQVRSSWLSREGLAAVLTYLPAGAYAVGWIFLGRNDGVWALLGLLTAICAGLTVYSTAMIYASLRPIQRWSNGWTAPNYLLLAAATGSVWLAFLTAAFGLQHWILPALATLLLLLAGLSKVGYWHFIETSRSASTAESATGLGFLGRVFLFEAPHTEANYLLKEMGYRIARKHAARLRMLAFLAGFALPALLCLATLAFDGRLSESLLLAGASLLATGGALVERWLFFAEAKHTVTLYYGASTA
jgi:sulfite dehydrogenase (quinone) subunit SoeC